MDELIVARAEILKAIAQPTRMKIVEFLRDGERCVCEIYPAIAEEQSNTSRHLNLMQGCGILARRKEERDMPGKYRIQIMPTQVFYDAKGKEVKRHMGFMDRDEIIAEFKALGVK